MTAAKIHRDNLFEKIAKALAAVALSICFSAVAYNFGWLDGSSWEIVTYFGVIATLATFALSIFGLVLFGENSLIPRPIQGFFIVLMAGLIGGIIAHVMVPVVGVNQPFIPYAAMVLIMFIGLL